jgi:hypothetical protein
MRCARVKGLLSDYVDGLLDPERAALVQKHVAQCGKCQKELESLQALIHELRSLEPVKAPEGFLSGLHERLEQDSWFTRLKAFLTIPARIRIPMEMATLATTIIIAFFIFHLMPFNTSRQLPGTPMEKTIASKPAPLVAPGETAVPLQEAKDDSGKNNAPVLAFKPPETTVRQRRSDITAKGNLDEKEKIQAENEKKGLTASADAEKRAAGTQTVQTPMVKAEGTDQSQVSYDIQTEDLKLAEPQSKTVLVQGVKGKEGVQKADHLYGRVQVEMQPIQIALQIGSDYAKRTASTPTSQAIQSNLELPKKEEPQPPAAGPQVQNQPGQELSRSKAIAAGGALGVAALKKEDNRKTTEEEILIKIQNILAILGGRTTGFDLNKETRQPEYLNIEIPADNFKNFVAELNKVGTLNIPAEQAGEPYPQTLRIRLQLTVQK